MGCHNPKQTEVEEHFLNSDFLDDDGVGKISGLSDHSHLWCHYSEGNRCMLAGLLTLHCCYGIVLGFFYL